MFPPSHLKLWTPAISRDFDGNLYFILGPGLGDTVNDFRILKEISLMYPQARGIVYADPRWKDLYAIIPELGGMVLRYYPPAPCEVVTNGGEYPFYKTFEEILREITGEMKNGGKGYIALGRFTCASQLPQKENSLSNKAKAIGLSLSSERERPYFPLSQRDYEEAQRWLAWQGLTPNKYIVFCSQTQADKRWPDQSWKALLDELFQVTGIPLVMVGVPGEPLPTHTPLYLALGLPLPVVAALISGGLCFVGLDSGLTHVAAAFNVPIVTLNPNGKFPPFLVEPTSSNKWTILTPGVYGNDPIAPHIVMKVIQMVLQRTPPPCCPLCHARPFVLGGNQQWLVFLCRCGLLWRLPLSDARLPLHAKGQVLPPELTVVLEELKNFTAVLQRHAKNGTDQTAKFSFDHWDPVKTPIGEILQDNSERDMWWTWDAVYQFLSSQGWRVISSDVKKTKASDTTLQVLVTARPGVATMPINDHVRVPWGNCVFSVTSTFYEDWLSWGTFRKQDELEGLGWLLVKEGRYDIGGKILKLAFRSSPSWKSMGRLLRTWLWSFIYTIGQGGQPRFPGERQTLKG